MRDCENCKHRVMKVEVGKGTSPEHFWGCECWECEFEPTTKNDLGIDCIDRQATLDAIIKRLGIKNETYLLEAERVIYQQILAMPSVTPQEPKTGHWISFGVQGEVDGQIVRVFICSVCGAISIFRMASGNIANGDLCPNCGAKMVEPQKSEEEE